MDNPRRIRISGDVVYFHSKIDFYDDKEEETARQQMNEIQERVQYEIDIVVREILGKGFRLRSMAIGRGSIELFLALAAAGSFYMGFSRYKNFVESLELLTSQITAILRRFMPSSTVINTSWIPGEVLDTPKASETPSLHWYTNYQIQMVLLIYFVVSHAALLGVVLWLLIKRLP